MKDRTQESVRIKTPNEEVLIRDLMPRVVAELHQRFKDRLFRHSDETVLQGQTRMVGRQYLAERGRDRRPSDPGVIAPTCRSCVLWHANKVSGELPHLPAKTTIKAAGRQSLP
jgi:hypothetical protein